MGFTCKIFGHKWNGCKCEKCGTIRDEQHDWDLCKGKCRRCGKTQTEQHEWNGCKCSRCGKVRDEQHDWNVCICKICGKTRDAQHKWNDYKCEYCNKLQDISDITDKNELIEIAKNTSNYDLILKIAGMLTDLYFAQKLYDDIEKRYKRGREYYKYINLLELAEKLNNKDLAQQVYFHIAKHCIDYNYDWRGDYFAIRMDAAKRLTDQKLKQIVYASIANSYRDYNCSFLFAAAKKLDDKDIAQETYIRIAMICIDESYDYDFSMAVINEITDKNFAKELSSDITNKFRNPEYRDIRNNLISLYNIYHPTWR